MKLTAVITTRNEAANIANCIHAFDAFRDQVEIVVVDNQSTDDTKKIAAELGATVLDKGPERRRPAESRLADRHLRLGRRSRCRHDSARRIDS